MNLPDYLVQGEEARLIPVAAGNQRERAACSVLLATLRIVEPFAQAVFGELGRRVGRRTSIGSYTEVVFANQPDEIICRHDGLLVLENLRSEWRALVECKIGGSRIEPEQVAQYCRVARANGVDAIITISNEPTPRPAHLPYETTRESRNIELYHWSWSRLVAIADRLLEADHEFDDEQQLILREMVRYFDYETSEVKDFNQMGSGWASLVQRIVGGASLTRNDPDVRDAVCCWNRAQDAVCTRLSRELRVPISVWLARAHREDQTARVTDGVIGLVENKALYGSLEFPNLAGTFGLEANVMARTIVCNLELQAPRDRQRYAARLRWLLNQLPEESDPDAIVEFTWERGARSRASIADLRRNPDAGRLDIAGAPNYFNIAVVTDLSARFAGTRNFVPALDDAVAHFYETIARHVRPWQPSRTPPVGIEFEDDLAATQGPAIPPSEPERHVTQRGEVGGRAFSVFNDGSIEIETSNGIQRFNSLAELNAAAAAKNGHAGSHNRVS